MSDEQEERKTSMKKESLTTQLFSWDSIELQLDSRTGNGTQRISLDKVGLSSAFSPMPNYAFILLLKTFLIV
jgi:hypothetical protein